MGTPGFTAELDLTNIAGSGDTGVLTTDLALGSIIAGASSGFLASFDSSTVGSFAAAYTISVFDDQDVTGFAAGNDLVLNLTGVVQPSAVIPEPSTFALALMAMMALGLLTWRSRV